MAEWSRMNIAKTAAGLAVEAEILGEDTAACYLQAAVRVLTRAIILERERLASGEGEEEEEETGGF